MFSVRIVTLNHYQAPPIKDLDVTYSEFRGSEVKQVPVVRVFGSTPSGQKTCLHVHGVFPYIYIPYDGTQPADHYMHRLASSLDMALQVAQGKGSSTFQHVFKISLVSGTPIYGYHKSERQFLKIYFYNPAIRKRAVELLENGAVMNKIFQPHESHVPFNLQFLIDYNLYGMNMLNLAAVKFRRSKVTDTANQKTSSGGPSTSFNVGSLPHDGSILRRRHSSSGSLSVCTQYWQNDHIPASQWLGDEVARQSTCELEVDAVGADILNRMDLQDNAGTNPGLVAIWEDERHRRQRLDQMDKLLPPSSPDRGEIPLFSAEEKWKARLQEISDKQIKELQDMESQVLGTQEEPMDTESSDDILASSSPPASIPCTPANKVEYHYSQRTDIEASQRQSLSGEHAPIVNEELVHSILEASQRMSQSIAQDTCDDDDELARLLVDLAEEEEEEDLALSGRRRSTRSSRQQTGVSGIDISDNEAEASPENEAEEEKEMSQAWLFDVDDDWGDDVNDDKGGGTRDINGKSKQMAGIDSDAKLDNLLDEIEDSEKTRSQRSKKSDEDDNDLDEYLPQLDGSSDVKPKDDDKKHKPFTSVGSGRLGSKSPRKLDDEANPGRLTSADKIARSPHKPINGPLADISDAIESLMTGSPKKKGTPRKRERKVPASRSRTPRSMANGKTDGTLPNSDRPSRVRNPRTLTNGKTGDVSPSPDKLTRAPRGSRGEAGDTSSARKRVKRSLQLEKPGKSKGKVAKRRQVVCLGRGRMGNKSPRKPGSVGDGSVPFVTDNLARSPQKTVTGPLGKYSNVIEYNMAPCFQYAEALKPKKSFLPAMANMSPMVKTSDGTILGRLERSHSLPKVGASRSRRISGRSDDSPRQQNARTRNPSKSDSVSSSSGYTPQRMARRKSELTSRANGKSPRNAEVKNSPRLQRSKSASTARMDIGEELSSDEDFKDCKPFAQSRRTPQKQRSSVQQRTKASKDARKMTKGKRTKKSYAEAVSEDVEANNREEKAKCRSPMSSGSGRGGQKSPRKLQRNNEEKPFISDKLIRSPNKAMQGPISVYSETIGYKMAPMFQYAEAVKPKPKVVLIPLEFQSQSSMKSPKSITVSQRVTPAKVERRKSFTVCRTPDGNVRVPHQSPSPRGIRRTVSSPDDSTVKSFKKDRGSPGSKPRSTKSVQGRKKSDPRPLTLQKAIGDNAIATDAVPLKKEKTPSPLFNESFVFEANVTNPATVGRGHMGARSPKDLQKMDISGKVLTSKAVARSPLKYVSKDLPESKQEKKRKKLANKNNPVSTSLFSKEDSGMAPSDKKAKEKPGRSSEGNSSEKKKTLKPKSESSKKKTESNKHEDGKKSSKSEGTEKKLAKKSRKPTPLIFDPVTMPSVKLGVRILPKLAACKALNPQLILRKLCLDEESWGEVVRNAIYRDLNRQAKRKRSQDEADLLESKKVRRGITPPWRKGPLNSSPRKEQLKALMAAKEGKNIYKLLKSSQTGRRPKSAIRDIFGGGPNNKSWNYVPPIANPADEITKNPIPEISEPSKDDSRDVMWQLACYSPQRPEKLSSPPRCWSPLGTISDVEDEEVEEEDAFEGGDGTNGNGDHRRGENGVSVPISDNEMDIIERNLGQITDFSDYEKMLAGTTQNKVAEDDVSGIDNHLHGDSEKDAISDEFAKLDHHHPDHHRQISRFGKENLVPQQHGRQIHHDRQPQQPMGSQQSRQQHDDGHQNNAQLKHAQESSPLLPQQTLPTQVASHSQPSNSQGTSNSSGSSSQPTPGQKPPAPGYFPGAGTSSHASHSPRFERSQSNSTSSSYTSQGQRGYSQTPEAQGPSSIPETDSEHSNSVSPPQGQYGLGQSSQQNHSRQPVFQPGNRTPNASMYYHRDYNASQSMYDMSSHSFNQSPMYPGDPRQHAPSQGYNHPQPPPYPSPGGNQPSGYPPPYRSPHGSYMSHPHPSPTHPNQSLSQQHPSPSQQQPLHSNVHPLPSQSPQMASHSHPLPSQPHSLHSQGQPLPSQPIPSPNHPHQSPTHPQMSPRHSHPFPSSAQGHAPPHAYGAPYPHGPHSYHENNSNSNGQTAKPYPQGPNTYPETNTNGPTAKPKIWRPVAMPPTESMVRSSLPEYGLPEVHHQGAYWGNPQDSRGRQREGLGQSSVQNMLPSTLQQADTPCGTMGLSHWQTVVQSQGEPPASQGYSTTHQGYNRDSVWTPSKYPPPRGTVTNWLQDKQQRHPYGQDSGTNGQYQQHQQLQGQPVGRPSDQHQPQGQQAVRPPEQSPGRGLPLVPSSQQTGNMHSPHGAQYTPQSHSQERTQDGISSESSQQTLCPSQQASLHIQSSGDGKRQQTHPGHGVPVQSLAHESSPSATQNVEGTSKAASNVTSTSTTDVTKTPSTTRHASKVSAETPIHTRSSRIQRNAKDSDAPLSSTPLRPLAGSSALDRQPPGVTPIASQKSRPLMDLRKQKNPLSPATPAQGSPITPLQKKRGLTSQIEGPTPKNAYGFKVSQGNVEDAKALHVVQHVTTMSLEVHARTRRDYNPDPDFDPIRALFYCIHTDGPPPSNGNGNHNNGSQECQRAGGDEEGHNRVGMIAVLQQETKAGETGTAGNATDASTRTQRDWLARSGVVGLEVTYVANEKEMFDVFIKLVRKHDPDILAGFEIQQLSWGYLFQRAAFLEVHLCQEISRLPDNEKDSHFSADKDAYGADHMSEITVAGRIMLNLWRIIRHEVNLNIYSFENVAYHVLHQRLPLFSFRTLTDWFDHITACYRWRTIEFYATRVLSNIKLIQRLDLIGRTSELARLFGIEFYSVLSRGTQYRVESMMLRQAKCANFIAVSPSVQQRSRSKAPECIPLVMEPESRFYEDPVVVLDFQALYPSMMIAYNYCYSTCLGRVEHIAQGGNFAVGCHTLTIPTKQLKHLLDSDGVHIAPNGIAFVKHSVRHGVLPRMLDQILNTRIMVKMALKDHRGDKVLERMLDNRQLGLKLIANVTYGYTSANFSGRMPCIEVGDSVVRKGRETLERAIKMVETTSKWGAKVVYGDTDSLFVLVKGATKDRAFEVGREIVAAVTAENPKPVKLKLEKVYKPCVLQSKKRYVGYKYESPEQKSPDFDAKGIETVRRDSCPAVSKILERSLKILFETKDVSKVKQYVQQQFQKMNSGSIGLQDLVFAKEYRGRPYYKAGACVPALEIAKRKLSVDRRAEPRISERVPYVVVHGSPGLPLIQLVRTPQEYLADPSYQLNNPYYITRQVVPSLNRVFGIMGVDTLQWYQELPRSMHIKTVPGKNKGQTNKNKGTISQYFQSLNCVVCDRLTKSGLCETCRSSPQPTVTSLMKRVQEWDRARAQIVKMCTSCCGFEDSKQHCVTLDCPNRFQLAKTEQRMDRLEHFLSLAGSVSPAVS